MYSKKRIETIRKMKMILKKSRDEIEERKIKNFNNSKLKHLSIRK